MKHFPEFAKTAAGGYENIFRSSHLHFPEVIKTFSGGQVKQKPEASTKTGGY